MTTLRADNKRLTQSVAELRADRRAQDRKIRDLEHQVALLQEKQLGSEPVPVLPVEVMAPPTPKDSARVVGISSDGPRSCTKATRRSVDLRSTIRRVPRHHRLQRVPRARPRPRPC